MDRMKRLLFAELLLSLGGVLFAGYLSGAKLFTGTCAFNEPCPYFLGFPACWYGFALFLILFVVAVLAFRGAMAARKAGIWLASVAGLGIVFSGSFVVQEVYGWLSVGRLQGYGLGLPTCVYGLVFYIIVFCAALFGILRRKGAPPEIAQASVPPPPGDDGHQA